MRRVKQRTRFDCGIAATAMLLDKRYDTIHKVFKLRKTLGNGSEDIMKKLKNHGYKCTLVHTMPRGNKRYMVLVKWWNKKTGRWVRHWCVWEKGRMYDTGPIKYHYWNAHYKFIKAIRLDGKKESN